MEKTELLKELNLEQFTKHQLEEIFKGLKENLDITWYAKPDFDFVQMQEIRKGLKNKVDVSIYAKECYCFW